MNYYWWGFWITNIQNRKLVKHYKMLLICFETFSSSISTDKIIFENVEQLYLKMQKQDVKNML